MPLNMTNWQIGILRAYVWKIAKRECSKKLKRYIRKSVRSWRRLSAALNRFWARADMKRRFSVLKHALHQSYNLGRLTEIHSFDRILTPS